MRAETFHTPGRVRLELRVPAGSIAIETREGEETHVEVESVDGDAAIEEATIIDHRDGRVIVAMEEERKFLFIKTVPGIRVRVWAPPEPELEVQTVSADVDARGARLASVELRTVSGDTRFDWIGGDLRLRSVSGDTYVDEVVGNAAAQAVSGDLHFRRVGGELDLRSVSGDANVEEAGGGVTGQSVSGDIEIGAVQAGKVTLKTVSGDMTVGIRSGSALWIDAKSVSGDTTSDLPLGDAPPNGDAPLVELRATAMSGDIKVVRA